MSLQFQTPPDIHVPSIRILTDAERMVEELEARRCDTDLHFWMRNCTSTKDEQDPLNPYKPFPSDYYIGYVLAQILDKPRLAFWKSRSMMLSWIVAAYCLWRCCTKPATGVVIQSEDETRAINMVNYCKILWARSSQTLQERWKLVKPLSDQPYNLLRIANDSQITGLVGNPAKMKSYHPTIWVADEAGIMTSLRDCLKEVEGARVLQAILISSAYPGYYHEMFKASPQIFWDLPSPAPQPGFENSMSPCEGIRLRKQSSTQYYFMEVYYHSSPRMIEAAPKLRANYQSRIEWDQEMEGKIDSLGGSRVYSEFNPRHHVIPDAQIPTEGCLYMSLDPHPRTPHAALWCLVDRYGDLFIYREFWPSIMRGIATPDMRYAQELEHTILQYAECLAWLEGNDLVLDRPGDANATGRYIQSPTGERITTRYIDYAARGFRATGNFDKSQLTIQDVYENLGFSFLDAQKSHALGVEAIRNLLKLTPHQLHGLYSRIHIAESCIELVYEFENYKYKQTRLGREVNQDTEDIRCHGLDNLRYLACAHSALDGSVCHHPRYVSRRSLRTQQSLILEKVQ